MALMLKGSLLLLRTNWKQASFRFRTIKFRKYSLRYGAIFISATRFHGLGIDKYHGPLTERSYFPQPLPHQLPTLNPRSRKDTVRIDTTFLFTIQPVIAIKW